jgi:predicted  nucleic acid-binding Zn-ribbon protein
LSDLLSPCYSASFQEQKVEAKEREINDVKRQEEQRLEKLEKVQKELEAVEKEIQDLPPFQPKTEEIVSRLSGALVLGFESRSSRM